MKKYLDPKYSPVAALSGHGKVQATVKANGKAIKARAAKGGAKKK